MRAEIEVKEIKLDSINIYIHANYGGDGFYLVTDEFNGKSFMAVLFPSVWYLGNNIPTFISINTLGENQPKPEEKFSEEFILKLVAIAANKENYKNLTQPPFK